MTKASFKSSRSEVIDLSNTDDDVKEEEEDEEQGDDDYARVPPEHFNESCDPSYEEDPSNPVPGDLVLTTLADMSHPARRQPIFGPTFLILGAVVGSKKVGIDMIEAWKQGVTFKHYKGRERLYVAEKRRRAFL